MFDGIEFRRIAWEGVDMESLGPLQKGFDVCSLVDSTSIPKQDHMSAQMAQQIPQEGDDFCSSDVFHMEADIKTQAFAARRDCKSADNRDFVASIAVAQDRCTANWGPGSTDIGNEQKSAFIEKGQMGSKFFCFFLYQTTCTSSNKRWHFRLFAGRGAPASDSSSQDADVEVSKRQRECNQYHNFSELTGQYALTSIGQWNAQLRRLLAATVVPVFLFVRVLRTMVVPIELDSELHLDLSCDKFDTIAPLNLRTILRVARHRDKSALRGAILSLDICGFLADWDSHEVSYPTA